MLGIIILLVGGFVYLNDEPNIKACDSQTLEKGYEGNPICYDLKLKTETKTIYPKILSGTGREGIIYSEGEL